MTRRRMATLVVLNEKGTVQGITDPIPLAKPWWPEVWPIIDLLPNAVVLRLLNAKAEDGQRMGGEVSYLVQITGEINIELHPWHGTLESHPLRMPWAEAGQAATDMAWVSSHVKITGTPRQCKSWNLSCVWSIPTRQGTVWLKCVPSFFRHEAVVIRSLPPNAGPDLLAAAGHRLLMAAMPGVDGHDASEFEQHRMLSALVEIQLASVKSLAELVQLGVPDYRGNQLQGPMSDLVHRLAPDCEPLQQLIDELPERLSIANNCGFPDTLVHGDAHSGNCRLGTSPPLWFDWGDSFIGHPLLELATISPSYPGMQLAWLGVWAKEIPGCNPRKAWDALKPVAILRQALVYQCFLDNIEPSERIYHADDPTRILRELAVSLQCSG